MNCHITIESSKRIIASNSISPRFHFMSPELTPPPPSWAISTTCSWAKSSHLMRLSIPTPTAFIYKYKNVIMIVNK